jgi:Protein of unknown function (DUF3618)
MSQDPDVIRQQIETTRSTMSSDVNSLADTVRPGNVARRQVGRVKGAATNAREKVMGAAPGSAQSGDAWGGSTSTGGNTLGDAASATQGAVRSAPGTVMAKAQGNPLAAGLIAFGAGWLVSSLAPTTRQEEQVGALVKENAAAVTSQLSDVAREAGEHLREPAQEAAESVRSAASDASHNVRDQGSQAKETVQQGR